MPFQMRDLTPLADDALVLSTRVVRALKKRQENSKEKKMETKLSEEQKDILGAEAWGRALADRDLMPLKTALLKGSTIKTAESAASWIKELEGLGLKTAGDWDWLQRLGARTMGALTQPAAAAAETVRQGLGGEPHSAFPTAGDVGRLLRFGVTNELMPKAGAAQKVANLSPEEVLALFGAGGGALLGAGGGALAAGKGRRRRGALIGAGIGGAAGAGGGYTAGLMGRGLVEGGMRVGIEGLGRGALEAMKPKEASLSSAFFNYAAELPEEKRATFLRIATRVNEDMNAATLKVLGMMRGQEKVGLSLQDIQDVAQEHPSLAGALAGGALGTTAGALATRGESEAKRRRGKLLGLGVGTGLGHLGGDVYRAVRGG